MNYHVMGQSGTGSASDLARAKEGALWFGGRQRGSFELGGPFGARGREFRLRPRRRRGLLGGGREARSPDLHRQTQRRLRPRDGGN